MVLDMQGDGGMPLILGRPFLTDVNVRINVGFGTIRFCNMMIHIQATEEQCYTLQGTNEQSGEWTKPQPHQLTTTSTKPKKTRNVWREVNK
jgi:hypothetical protein